MRFSSIISALAVTAGVVEAGRSLQHVGKRDLPNKQTNRVSVPKASKRVAESTLRPRHLTTDTKKFAVNGSAIPDVDFDIGESYAGLLPISNKTDEPDQLYFWYFPTENAAATDEILIWLNGGPGCSSLEGFLQENGPFLWQYGTFLPVQNPYTWINLTNVVWVEQPVGTGFTTGTPTATSEADVTAQFMGFWKNFVDTFDLKGRKVYITGESYAGQYIPYLADGFLSANDTDYYNLEGTMIYDPSVASDVLLNQVPAVQFADYNYNLMPFNDSFVAYIHNKSQACGYDDYIEKYLTFPPAGPFPTELPGTDSDGNTLPSCDVFDDIFTAASVLNPCFDIYQIATTCPLLWDVLGFPGSFDYLPVGASIYFNRSDVKAAINAPVNTNWEECSSQNVFVNGTDLSPSSGAYNGPLASVIERSKKTLIVHASLDMVLLANGTMLMIQNLTWNGAQGFSSMPTDPFYVPYHDDPNPSTLAGSGVMGTTHTERGLTWVGVNLSGHMVPQYAPSAAYRQVEYLLGRISSLSEVSAFSTDPFVQPIFNGTNGTAIGNGTAPPVRRALGMGDAMGRGVRSSRLW